MKWKKKQNQKEERLEENNTSRLLGFFFFILISLGVYATPKFYFNSELILAQEQNYALKLAGAKSILLSQKQSDPDNCTVDYLLHFNVFLQAFISEDKRDYEDYEKVYKLSIESLERLADNEPYKRFALSEVHFYAATLRAKHNDLYAAAKDIKKAYNLVEENQELFPHFVQNNKTRGIIKTYISTVPESYIWVVKLLGIEGNMNEGLRLLQSLAYAKSEAPELKMIAQEASYIYSYALFHVAKQTGKSWSETLRCTKDYESNLLSTFFRSHIALKLNKNETAIKTLQGRPVSSEYQPFLFLDYQLGVALLNKQDESAITSLLVFYNKFKGSNYIKSCLQKMSWYYLLAGDYAKYESYKKLIPGKGVAVNDEDKQAARYAEKPRPDRYLLKSRLQFDGGYYEKALQTLENTSTKTLKTSDHKAEYCYRKGRIYDKLGRMDVAIKFYEACTLFAIQSTEYYGPYASLFIADYYLATGEKENARKYYSKALEFKQNKEYVDSIEHRAKQGLKKC
ncbi:MAG: hypothetical protein RLZZ337_896 [Bacteroidota bacterium]|jgi:hypothetical protein